MQFKHNRLGQSFAVKVVKCANSEDLGTAINEVEAMQALKDECVPVLHYYLIRGNSNASEVVMVMELCGSSLMHDIKQRQKCKEHYSK